MAQFIQENVHSNIIIVNIPRRHDIESNSTTNFEIHAANRKLSKIAKAYNNVKIVDSNLHRIYFTWHGLHLNKYGKEWLSKQIATRIHRLVEDNSKNTPLIPLKWKIEPISKQNSTNPLPEQTAICPIKSNELNDSVTVPVKASTSRECKWNRRLPKTRSDYFLWLTILGQWRYVTIKQTNTSTMHRIN